MLCTAASASDVVVDITELMGDFDLFRTVNYNIINLGNGCRMKEVVKIEENFHDRVLITE